MLVNVLFLCCLVVQQCIGYHCNTDQDLENVGSFQYQVTPHPRDMEFWRNRYFAYYVYGEFSNNPSNAVITAGLYKDGYNQGWFETKIYCHNQSWKVYYTTKEGIEKLWRNGLLNEPCKEGIFDLILKIDQQHRGYFIFNQQTLETDYKKKYRTEDGVLMFRGMRPQRIDTNLVDADTFKISVSDGAVITRFAFGKCWTFPHELKNNCSEAKSWVVSRSKRGSQSEEEFLGANMITSYPECYTGDERYWNYKQSKVHPDEKGRYGENYCCCSDMRTGELTPSKGYEPVYGDGGVVGYTEVETPCVVIPRGEAACFNKVCTETQDTDIIEAVITENTSE